MKSKEHDLLTDLLQHSKAIRLNNHVPKSEVDLHMGIDGICNYIELGEWTYQRDDSIQWDEPISLYKFMQYLAFIDCGIMTYNTAPEDEIEKHQDKDKAISSEYLKNVFDDMFRIFAPNVNREKP